MSKEKRLCTNPEEWNVLQFKRALEKNKPLYDELIQILSNVGIEIKAVKTLNMDVSSFVYAANWTDEQIESWIEQVSQYYIKESEINASWMSDHEKLETIKRSDDVARIAGLFGSIKYPLLHGNTNLLDFYCEEYIKEYVYHPEAIKAAKQISRIVDEMQQFKISNNDIYDVFSTFGLLRNCDYINNHVLEKKIGVKPFDLQSITNVKYKPFKKAVLVTEIKPIVEKYKPTDYSPKAVYARHGITPPE